MLFEFPLMFQVDLDAKEESNQNNCKQLLFLVFVYNAIFYVKKRTLKHARFSFCCQLRSHHVELTNLYFFCASERLSSRKELVTI